MLHDPYSLLAVVFFVLAFLVLVLLWALDRIRELERKVTRIERAWARELALFRDVRNGYPSEDYSPEDPAAVLKERRR